jgi:DnaJ-domain-containing protein 1
MQGEIRRRLTTLCSEATDEQDPQRFRQIVHEMNLLLQEKQDRLDKDKHDKESAE